MAPMLNTAQVREACGQVSDMTIWRWSNDQNVGFPAPVYVNRRRYWRADDIAQWWASRSK
jgi:predicted DNA-binding transcriptional regulator AlpA